MWYSLVMPASGEVTIQTTLIFGTTPSSMNINAAAYTGTCGSLTLISCDANSGPGFYPELTINEPAGSTVFIQLWETNNNVQGDFSICANGTTSCTPPTVNFAESCIGNNQYEVDVFISNLGDASSLDITNDGGAPAITGVSGTGIQTVGPFDLGTTPTITVQHNDDGTCNVSQQVTDVGLACENVLTCGVALSQQYCYQNNDNTSFLYSSPDGSPLTIEFLSGTLEDGVDDITIRNGSNGSAPILFQGSNGGDLSGLSETASSGSIFLTVDSDISGSCEDDSFDFGLGWEWEVSCDGCVAPAAGFIVVEDCAAGTFTVDVDITSLGNSSALSISNDAGVAATTGVSGTGVQNVGPFTIGSPVAITVASEDISGCEIVQTGLDFDCPVGSNCANATSITSQVTFNLSEVDGDLSSVIYSQDPQCNGPGDNPDPYFSFTAVGSTQYFRVRASGDFDPAVEVFDGCGGEQLACIDDQGPGVREIFWLNDLTPGETYVYRVYHAGASDPSTTSFETSVAHIPFVELRAQDCGSTDLDANSIIRANLPQPNFLLEGFVFEFTEQEAPFNTYEVQSPNGANPNFILGWFNELEYGRSYSVRVAARMYQGPNLGDYGNACTISTAAAPTTFLLPGFENGFYDMCDQLRARKLLGATNYRWVFDDGVAELEYNSGIPTVFCPLQQVQGLQLGTTYSVTVFATDAAGVESAVSIPRNINMNNFVPNTEINPVFGLCGTTVPSNQVVQAVEVCSAEQYTFRFENLSQVTEPIEIVRPTRVLLLSFVAGLVPGDTYDVTVFANSGGLEGDFSSACQITIEAEEGLVEFETEANVSGTAPAPLAMTIFPNPSQGSSVQIAFSRITDSQPAVLEVFDLQGKMLHSELTVPGGLYHQMDLSSLSKGMYLVQARIDNEILSSEKLIID